MIILIGVPSDLFYWDICTSKHRTAILMQFTCDPLLLASETGRGTLHYDIETVSDDSSLLFITQSRWYGTEKSNTRLATGNPSRWMINRHNPIVNCCRVWPGCLGVGVRRLALVCRGAWAWTGYDADGELSWWAWQESGGSCKDSRYLYSWIPLVGVLDRRDTLSLTFSRWWLGLPFSSCELIWSTESEYSKRVVL